MDRTVARPDLGYLRRRPQHGETPPVAAAPAATGSLALALGPPAAPAALPAQRPVPRVRGRSILKSDARWVSLDRRQSAIGSLAFDVTPRGQLNGVWELVDGTAGTVSESGGITISPEFGRRSLVQLRKGRLLVGLRHVQQLRRLLVVVTGLGPDAGAVRTIAALYGGATIESAHESDRPAVASLALYHVGGELVVRREGSGFASLAEASAAYGFAATWTPPPAHG